MWRFRHHSILIVSEEHPDPAIEPDFLRQPDIRLFTSPHETAFEVARREHPSLIIGDLRAPRPSALESCRKLRADRRTRSIPLILVGSPCLREDLRPVEPGVVVSEPIIQQEYFDAVRLFVPLPKRRETRQPVNLRFSYHDEQRRGQAFSRDLSADGALLNTQHSIPLGSQLDLTFCLPGEEEEIRCAGMVVRTAGAAPDLETTGGLAVAFDGMGENDRRRLAGFLASLAAR